MTTMSDALHERATRLAMRRLLPVLLAAYFMSYVDRTNVALAKTDLAADVGIGAAAYGLGAGLFFLTYALFEVPSNLVLYRVGARIWITRIALTWGAVSAAMMFVQGPVSYYVLRLLLGAAEAGLFPALMYLTTIWFAQKHRVTVIGIIYVAPTFAMVVGAPLGGALMELEGIAGLQGWQWLFLVEGLLTMVIGVVVWRLLPNRPSDASWLSADEAEVLSARAAGGAPHATRLRGNLRAAFGRPFVVVLALIYFLNQTVASGIGFNLPATVKALGVSDPFDIGLIVGAGGIAALVGVLFFPFLARRHGHEVRLIGICAVAAMLAVAGSLLAFGTLAGVLLLFVAGFFTYGTLPLFWSVATSRMAGIVAAAGLAFINTIGLIGGFVGPFAFGAIEEATGGTWGSFVMIAAVAVLGAALVPVLARCLRRERVVEPPAAASEAPADDEPSRV